MLKVAIVVLADTETHEGLARVVNAMEAVKEFKEAKDEVQLIFDGAGTKWMVELVKKEHKAHRLYEAVRDRISGACDYCAGAFGVKSAIQGENVKFLRDYEGHPSFRKLLQQGYQVITF